MTPRRYWTEDRIVAALRAWAARTGRPPTTIEWHRRGPDWPCHGTVLRVYGSWAAALDAAGLECAHPYARRGRWPPERIVAAMQAWAERQGRRPTYTDWVLAGPDRPSAQTVEHASGSWQRALRAAGLAAWPRAGGDLWSPDRSSEDDESLPPGPWIARQTL